MNKPVPDFPVRGATPLAAGAPELERLFDHIAQGASERERLRILPYEAIDLIRYARLGALRLAREDGGAGASFRELFDIVIRLGAADANVAHILRNHFTIAEQYARRPRGEQARRWQKAVADGAIIGLASAELGSPQVGAVKPDTVLTPDGDGYRLDGVKFYSTGTMYADYVLVRVAGADDALAAVIIPVKRDGIELVDDWDGIGQRLTGSGTTHFRDVRVERDEVVFDSPDVGYGLPYSNTQAQLFLTAIVAGIIRGILDEATALVRSRGRTFYYAPAERAVDDPILHQTVGQIAAHAFAAEAAVLAAADALDAVSKVRDEDADSAAPALHAALQAAKAKVIADELALRSGGLLFDVGGASAAAREKNFDRHWRNARTLASHNPSTYKAMAIGRYEIDGTPPPGQGFF